MGAGQFRERLRFEKRTEVSDGGGGHTEGWASFSTGNSAKIIVRTGSEQVLAERLKGILVHDITLRYSSKTKDITTDMRAVNERTGEIYNITSPPRPDPRKRYISITATTGTAA